MLPKIDLPLYELTLPVINKKIQIRPFTVKENKILLMALEGGDANQILLAMKQIVNNCVITSGFNVDDIGFYNVEYILLNLRSCSISEKVSLVFSGKENSECKTCRNPIEYELNLNEVKVNVPKDFQKKFTLKCGLTVGMKEPTYEAVNKLKLISQDESGLDQFFEFVANAVEYVADAENVYTFAEVSQADKIKFVESLGMSDFETLQSFFGKLPTLRHEIDLKCSECGFEQKAVLEGVDDFLG